VAWEGIALFSRSPIRTRCGKQHVLCRSHTRFGQCSELEHSPASAHHQGRMSGRVTASAVNHSRPPYREQILPTYRLWLPFLYTAFLYAVLLYAVLGGGATKTSAALRINLKRLVRPSRLQLSRLLSRQQQLRQRRLCQPLRLHVSWPIDLFLR